MEIEDPYVEELEEIKFKIDLIVWKCSQNCLESSVVGLFKIDLIVWKYQLFL